MKIKATILIGALTLPILAGCGPTKYNVTFYQEEGNRTDTLEVVDGTTTAEDIATFQSGITLNPRKGYDVDWEQYNVETILAEKKDFTVNATYTLHEYTITYKYGDDVLGSAKYTINSTKADIVEPALPVEAGYTFAYENYTIENKTEDFVVNARRSVITYHAKFVDEEGTQVGELVPFTVETESITEPAVPEKAGFTGAWSEYTLGTEDITINPDYTPITYYATFVDKDGTQVGEKVPFTTLSETITEPEVPSVSYKTGAWETYTLKGRTSDITIHPVYTAITYKAFFKETVDDENPVVIEFNADAATITTPSIDAVEHYTKIDWLEVGTEIHAEGGKSLDLTTKLGNNVEFVKYFVGEKHTITLNKNGGTLSETSVSVEYGKAYELPTPTFKNGVANFLGWFDAKTGEEVTTTGTSAFISDTTLIARYIADFSTDTQKGAVVNGSRNCVGAKDIIDDADISSKVLKITTTASTTFSCSFDQDFINAAFADENVVAINFDAKSSAPCTKLSYGNREDAPYEHDCCADNQQGFGSDVVWKTFSLTREMYAKKVDNNLICTVGGQLPVGGFFYFDNIRPVSQHLTIYGFESGRLVDTTQAGYYHHTISYRNFANQEVIVFNTNNDAGVYDCGRDYSVKTEGNCSIKWHRVANFWHNLNIMNSGNVSSITFDIRFSIDLNGNTLRFGNGESLIPTTEVKKANEWYTFTVEKAKFNGNTFMTFNGSPEFDLWVDNIRFTLAD